MIQPQQCGQVGFGGPWTVRQTAEANSVLGALPLCSVVSFGQEPCREAARWLQLSGSWEGVAGCSHPPREVAVAGESPRRWAAV